MEPFTSNETLGSYKKSLYSPGDDPIAFFHVMVGFGYLKDYITLLLTGNDFNKFISLFNACEEGT